MNAADTAWIMTATALVLFMTLPGLALFYGGPRAQPQRAERVLCIATASLVLMSVLVVSLPATPSRLDRTPRVSGWFGQDRPVGRHRRKPVWHPARDPVFCLPDDLCDHHTSADRRRLC